MLSLTTSADTQEREKLYTKYAPLIHVNKKLDRTLVSFQANKDIPVYNWFKYKEGFSTALVEYLLKSLHPEPGVLLDPFAGSGTALFTARDLGWRTLGIEVLPVGIYIGQIRTEIEGVDVDLLRKTIEELKTKTFADYYNPACSLAHIPITKGAFPDSEEKELNGYIAYCHKYVENLKIKQLLLFAAFCILEDISYTRKDGQYLRWDFRSGRSQGTKPFNKGYIPGFREALTQKLKQMLYDLGDVPVQYRFDFEDAPSKQNLSNSLKFAPTLKTGSCLEILPTLNSQSIDMIITSPPYCNRYDYTRTYALELVYLGYTAEQVKQLRQAMLSCTVENRSKVESLRRFYASEGQEQTSEQIETVFQQQAALQEVLRVLEQARLAGQLNNNHISKMVRNYFYEMTFVIYELARVLKPGGKIVMVNDNVSYNGEEIPVDIILSEIAANFGLKVETIWMLERGKGNSSQQMGQHGRNEQRKCVYVWEKE